MTISEFFSIMVHFAEARLVEPRKVLLNPLHFSRLEKDVADSYGKSAFDGFGYHTIKLGTPVGMVECHADRKVTPDRLILYDSEGMEHTVPLKMDPILYNPVYIDDGTGFVENEKEVVEKRDTMYDAEF